jgi:hypothetical protein
MNSRYAKIEANGIKTTIGDYLSEEWLKVSKLEGNQLTNELNALGVLTGEEQQYLTDKTTVRLTKNDRKKKIIYSHWVRGKVSQQRLYLSGISRDGNFTPMLKKEIWNKVSEFLPSRIAAFFPEERKALITRINLTDVEWKTLIRKLWKTEADRTRKQMELVESDDFTTEAVLSDFYADNGITGQKEKDCIDLIVQLGRDKSEMLSKMVFSQSAFLDDAPEPEWMNLGNSRKTAG